MIAPRYRTIVKPEWADYNGHMNLAYYVVAFDQATDAMFERAGIGLDYVQRQNASVFVVETHTRYEQEAHVGEAVEVESFLFGAAGKRLHFGHAMFRSSDGARLATHELLGVHVDMTTRKSAPFPADRLVLLQQAAAALPDWAGKRIAALGG